VQLKQTVSIGGSQGLLAIYQSIGFSVASSEWEVTCRQPSRDPHGNPPPVGQQILEEPGGFGGLCGHHLDPGEAIILLQAVDFLAGKRLIVFLCDLRDSAVNMPLAAVIPLPTSCSGSRLTVAWRSWDKL
jgi:hypothetical protein